MATRFQRVGSKAKQASRNDIGAVDSSRFSLQLDPRSSSQSGKSLTLPARNTQSAYWTGGDDSGSVWEESASCAVTNQHESSGASSMTEKKRHLGLSISDPGKVYALRSGEANEELEKSATSRAQANPCSSSSLLDSIPTTTVASSLKSPVEGHRSEDSQSPVRSEMSSPVNSSVYTTGWYDTHCSRKGKEHESLKWDEMQSAVGAESPRVEDRIMEVANRVANKHPEIYYDAIQGVRLDKQFGKAIDEMYAELSDLILQQRPCCTEEYMRLVFFKLLARFRRRKTRGTRESTKTFLPRSYLDPIALSNPPGTLIWSISPEPQKTLRTGNKKRPRDRSDPIFDGSDPPMKKQGASKRPPTVENSLCLSTGIQNRNDALTQTSPLTGETQARHPPPSRISNAGSHVQPPTQLNTFLASILENASSQRNQIHRGPSRAETIVVHQAQMDGASGGKHAGEDDEQYSNDDNDYDTAMETDSEASTEAVQMGELTFRTKYERKYVRFHRGYLESGEIETMFKKLADLLGKDRKLHLSKIRISAFKPWKQDIREDDLDPKTVTVRRQRRCEELAGFLRQPAFQPFFDRGFEFLVEPSVREGFWI